MDMKKFLFRGQTRRFEEKVKNIAGDLMESNWVYGGLLHNNNGGTFSIIYTYGPEYKKYPVYADTVGQFTEYKDIRSNRIYDGDILRIQGGLNDYYVAIVTWLDGSFMAEIPNNKTNKELKYEKLCSVYDKSEIIGNIYDNPELVSQSYNYNYKYVHS